MTCKEKKDKFREKMIAQLAALCKKYGLVTKPELLLTTGMCLNFDDNGNLEPYAEKDFEHGKKNGWFGNSAREMMWADHLGD